MNEKGSRPPDYYRTLFDASNDAMLVLEPTNGTILDANNTFTQWFGYPRSEWKSLPLSSFICSDSTDAATTTNPRIFSELNTLREECHRQCQMQAKSQQRCWVEVHLKPIQFNKQRCILAIIQDISEFKQNESRLRDSEKNWRSIAENVPDFIIVTDQQGIIQFINTVLPGYEKDDVIGKSILNFQPSEYHESMRGCLQQVFAQGEIATLETMGAGSPGELRHYISRFAPIKENNQVVSALVIATDITEQKKTLEALHLSEEKFKKAFYASPDVIGITRLADGKILEINDSFERITGYSKQEAIGRTTTELNLYANPSERQTLVDRLREGHSVKDFPWTLRTKAGELRDCLISSEVFAIGEEGHMASVIRDVTDTKKAEQALQQSRAELKQRNLSLATINAIADRVFHAFDVPTVAKEAVEAIAEFANSISISFYLVDRQHSRLELVHTTEPNQAMVDKIRYLPMAGSISGRAVTEKEIFNVEDLRSDTRLHERAKNAALRQGYLSVVCMPAIFKDEVLGIIHFAYKVPHKLSSTQYDTYSSIGKSIGLALGNARHISQLEIEMRERQHAEETLRNIAIGVSAATGDEFFRSLVTNVASNFSVDFAFLGKLDESTNDKIKTIAVWIKGSMGENFEYDLENTPCENVVNKQPCVFTDSVRQKFPKDAMLQEMGVESYVGTPLRSSSGKVIGLFVAMHSKPLPYPELMMSTLQIFSVRAAAEMERLASEAALRRSEEHLRLALNSSNVGTWEWDIASGNVTWSQNVEKIFNVPAGSFKGGYTEYFELIHPDDIAQVNKAIDDALNARRPYAVEHRVKCSNEGECWIYCQGEVYRDANGKPVRMLGTVSDVTERKNAELKVKASQKMLQLVLDSIPARVFWKDINSVYLGCNKLFAKDASIQSAQQIVGKTDFDMVWREQAERYRADDQAVMHSGLPKLQYEETLTQPDKATRWLETSKIPLTDLNGNIIGILGTYTDISERKQAIEDKRRSEQRLKLHFQHTPLAVIEWNNNMEVVEWNLAAERIFGYSRDEAVGQNVLSLIIPQRKRPQINSVADSLLHVQNGRRNINENITKDGRAIICDWYNTPLVDETGQVMGVASAAMDITERVKTEQELEQYREHLEELVEQRTDELTRVNKELEAFSYSVSHDLRAPLRSLDGFSQVLIEDYFDKLDEEGKDYLQRVRQGAQRMAQLIDDMLKLSRLTRSQLQHTSVNLSEIATEIASVLQKEAPERSAQFKITPNLLSYGDEGLLTVVLDNLISNAWKYTSKKSHSIIEFGARADEKETVYWIKDNGAGFNMEYVDKLFGAFQRLHHIREFEGSGIGLATVARIIHRHGGRVWAEGKENEGAIFYFTLPNTLNK